jgi:GNAT superfamily N-acetyltransferase
MIDNSKIQEAVKSVDPNYIAHAAFNRWGNEIFLMQKEGNGFIRLYWLEEDISTVYISWLSVSPDKVKQGIGKTLVKLCEQIGVILGAEECGLWVDKTEWMKLWYERLGYEFYLEHHEENYIWMKKSLTKNERNANSD